MDNLNDLFLNNNITIPDETYNLTNNHNHTIYGYFQNEIYQFNCKKEWSIKKFVEKINWYLNCHILYISTLSGNIFKEYDSIEYIKSIRIIF